MNARRDLPARAVDPQALRDSIGKTHDHTYITDYVHNVARY
jgi:hypothetical protein